MKHDHLHLRILWLAAFTSLIALPARADEPINIGARRELFVDQHLIERLDGVRLELNRPVRREIVLRTDAAWEGNGSAYQSVFQDGDRYRMYYRGGHHVASKAYETNKTSWETLCLAESKDGIHWTRPELGIVEFQGSTMNNLILDAAMVANALAARGLGADSLAERTARATEQIVVNTKDLVDQAKQGKLVFAQ